ncbi:nitrogen fixation protein NifU [Granulicatella balaenopterae]|uniref:Nitrogen fixation protein NifU n=1 Tax=Granulicatella balaenopterae TaxID=137733 RepID=A0A1H9ME57_9LACT|nr:SUF system NifU family Fe-S cluster assembly protein [Granulicatella balaenopterae]SER21765.1 nitrogen fixation protein NifU [Granulicatella balaenopterae]
MALSKLDNLYRQVILDHSSHPRNKGIVNDPAVHTIEFNNPTCGDVIQLQLTIDQDGRISNVKFDGHGCSISTASASMMTLAILNKTVDEALEMAETFSQMVQGQEVDDEALGDAALLSGVSKFPARIKCATLAWKALERSIEEQRKND